MNARIYIFESQFCTVHSSISGRGSARLERLVRDQEVGGSNPLAPTKNLDLLHHVYILYSPKIKKYYSGHTQDLNNRLAEHNRGESKFTKLGTPWKLIFSTEVSNKSQAIILENKIKKRGCKRFLEDNHLFPDQSVAL